MINIFINRTIFDKRSHFWAKKCHKIIKFWQLLIKKGQNGANSSENTTQKKPFLHSYTCSTPGLPRTTWPHIFGFLTIISHEYGQILAIPVVFEPNLLEKWQKSGRNRFHVVWAYQKRCQFMRTSVTSRFYILGLKIVKMTFFTLWVASGSLCEAVTVNVL